jgi:hypothetical protein
VYGKGWPWTSLSIARVHPALPFYALQEGHLWNGLKAVSGVARLQGGQLAAIFYSFGHLISYGPDHVNILCSHFLMMLFLIQIFFISISIFAQIKNGKFCPFSLACHCRHNHRRGHCHLCNRYTLLLTSYKYRRFWCTLLFKKKSLWHGKIIPFDFNLPIFSKNLT